jgi:hypothetical protein
VFDAFDILKKLSDGGIVWIEAVKDLETARERIKQLATYKPGEYVIFNQETQSVIEKAWVPFAREAPAATDVPPSTEDATTKQTQKTPQGKSSPTTRTIIADIIADISRSLHRR